MFWRTSPPDHHHCDDDVDVGDDIYVDDDDYDDDDNDYDDDDDGDVYSQVLMPDQKIRNKRICFTLTLRHCFFIKD